MTQNAPGKVFRKGITMWEMRQMAHFGVAIGACVSQVYNFPSLWARRQALWEQKSGVVLATHDLDDQARGAQEGLTADKGPRDAERGFRCLKAPPLLASSFDLKTPERMRARWRVRTVG